MFSKNMRIAFLLDFYGDILDGRAGAIMSSYYQDDLSLSEIADGEGISRQGVRHIIKKSEEQLEFLESRLRLAERFSKVESALDELRSLAERLSLGNDGMKAISAEILSITELIRKES